MFYVKGGTPPSCTSPLLYCVATSIHAVPQPSHLEIASYGHDYYCVKHENMVLLEVVSYVEVTMLQYYISKPNNSVYDC